MLYTPRKSNYISAFRPSEEAPLGIVCTPCTYAVNSICNTCGESFGKHFIINDNIICPNVYVIHEGGTIINVMTAESFEAIYKPVGEEI